MKKFDVELAVGIFMILGILSLGYLSIKLGKMEIFGRNLYDIEAVFASSGGLRTGASVTIAGVEVGRVKSVSLDDYQARIVMGLSNDVQIQEDAIASIKTKGLIGEKYVEISPGGSDTLIPPGGRIRETLPPVDLEQLISGFVFGQI